MTFKVTLKNIFLEVKHPLYFIPAKILGDTYFSAGRDHEHCQSLCRSQQDNIP